MNPKITSFINEKMQEIGLKYNLHIDQTGMLGTEILAIVSGKFPADRFVESVEEHLNIPVEQAIEISTDVNVNILLPVREMMLTPVKESNTEREDILSAIENPAPTEHPISIAQPKPIEKTRPSSEATDVAHAFIGEKLSTPVSIPSQKTIVTPAPISPVKQKPSVDPYREPIS